MNEVSLMGPAPDITFDPNDTETQNLSKLILGLDHASDHIDEIHENTDNHRGNGQCQVKTKRSFLGKFLGK